MKLFVVALFALATAPGAFAVPVTTMGTLVEGDDVPLMIPSQNEHMQTIVSASMDHKYRYTILVKGAEDREKVKDFVAVTVEARRRLTGTTAAEVVSTFVSLDRLVTISSTIMVAAELANLEYVESVDMDLGMYANVHYNWGNDRSDQDDLPTSRTYSPLATGKGQRVYIIDTGIDTYHEEFSYGARAEHGYNFYDMTEDASDGHSHGTHCAGTAVGSSIGMATDATAVAVKVLSNSGSGSSWGVIAGMDWATTNAIENGVVGIMSLSLGGPADNGMDSAMTSATAKGMIPVVAAGNSNKDACDFSPGRSTGAITVGAYNNADERATFTNWGACVDIFAPGRRIVSAHNSGPNSYQSKSGTSMAAPHVAGAIAVFLELLGGVADLDTMLETLQSTGGRDKLTGDIGQAPNLILRVPAQGETFSGRSTKAPTAKIEDPTKKPTKKPTVKPTKQPTKAPTVTEAVLTVDQASKAFKPAAIGPDFDPNRALNGYALTPDASNHEGCAEFTGEDFTGHIALIKRGGCSFYDKILHAQNKGAAGVVVYNSKAGDLVEMGYRGDQSLISITSFFISLEDGEAIVRNIAAGSPSHVFVGHPAHYEAPGSGRPDFGSTPAPTKKPTKLVTNTPTKQPTKLVTSSPTKKPTKMVTSSPSAAPEHWSDQCDTFMWYTHCMRMDEQRWTKCNWDITTSKCVTRTAMPCSQHRLWKSCNIHGDVCQFIRGEGCKERPVDARKPLPIENGPQCLNRGTKDECREEWRSCFWIESPAFQRGCFSFGGGGILEAGGSVDEPWTPESCNVGTYWQAHNYCEKNDMRLCSAHELRDDKGSTTNLSKQEANCDVTKRYMWTNARCGTSSVRTYFEESDTTKCQTVPSWRSRAGFRCCQDIPDTENF